MSSLICSKGTEKPLIYDTNPGTEIACAGANAYTSAQSGVIDCGSWRWLNLFVSVDAGAAGSQVSIVVGVSAAPKAPASTGRWYPPGIWDGAVTGSLLAAAPGMGSPALTATPDWGATLHRQLEIVTEPADGAGDEQAIAIPVYVGNARWAFVRYAQVDGGAAAKVLGYFTLGSG